MRSLFAALVLSLAVMGPVRAGTPPVQIFLAHAQPQNPETDPAAAAAEEFRTQLQRLSNGRLKVEIFPDGALGGNRQMAALAENGVIQSALVTVGGVTPIYPPLMVTQLPFAFDRVEAARAVLAGPFGRRLAADMGARTRLALMAFVDPGGFHVLTNFDREIASPDDMWGLRIRAIPGFKPLEAMILAVKAIPVQVSSRDEQSLLAANMVDGQMSPPPIILARNFDSAQRHVTMLNHLYSPYVWVFNGAFLAALPPEDAAAVHKAVQLAKAKAEAVVDRINRSDQGLSGLSKRMRVRYLSAAERTAFREIMQPPVEAAIVTALGEGDAGWMEQLKAAARMPAP